MGFFIHFITVCTIVPSGLRWIRRVAIEKSIRGIIKLNNLYRGPIFYLHTQ